MNRMLLCAAAAALSISACQRETENPGQSEPVNTVQDAMAGPVGQMSAATLGANTVQGYVKNAAESGMYEIQAAEIALQRAKTPAVREFAQMMQTDHTQNSNKLKAVVPVEGVGWPEKLDERRQGMLDNLKAAGDADFENVYMDQQVAAHQEALTLHRGYADGGDNAELEQFAAQSAPIIEQHLQRAQEIQAQIDQ